MRRNFFGIFIAANLVVLLLPGLNQAAQESIGAIYLNQAVGARPAAMGEAFIAVAEDSNTVFWNPAGIVRVKNIEFLAVHTEFIQNFSDEYFALTWPLSNQDAIGINGFFSYTTQLDKASWFFDGPDTFSAYDVYFSLAWSHDVNPHIATGLSLKGIYQLIDTYSAWNAAVDISFLISKVLPGINFGFALKNLGFPIKFIENPHTLPIIMEIGASRRFLKDDLLVTFDISKPLQEEIRFKLGGEYMVAENIYLRAGYAYLQHGNELGFLSGLTCGLGVNFLEYRLDYAFAPYAELGNIHRFSIILPLGSALMIEKEKIAKRIEDTLRAKKKHLVKVYMHSAGKYLKNGDYKNAIFYYEKVLVLDPRQSFLKEKISRAKKGLHNKNAASHYYRGRRAYAKADYITALIEWNKAYEISPSFKNVKQMLGKVHAKLTATKHRKTKPQGGKPIKKFDQYITKGFRYLRKGKYRNAISAWKKALAIKPNNARVKQYLTKTAQKMEDEITELSDKAAVCWHKGDKISAVKFWRKIVKIDPKNPRALKKLKIHDSEIRTLSNNLYLDGVQKYVENNLVEAISLWKDVLILDPENEKAYKHLNRAKDKMHEIEELMRN